MKIYQAELFAHLSCELGESAFWWPERESWCWVDILDYTIYIMDKAGRQQQFHIGEHVSTIVPVAGSNELLLGLKGRVASFSPERGLGETMALLDGRNNMRCNDGKCDPAGRLWIGTMQMPVAAGSGSLYCVEHTLPPVVKLPVVTIPNGLVWHGDKMYFNDTLTHSVQEFSYDVHTGAIAFTRVAVHIPKELGLPDGMTIDRDGMLWVAHWGGQGVYCWNPLTGELLAKVEVPAPHVSSCIFGGADMQEMLITTAQEHMIDAQLDQFPLSGSVFHVKLPVKGLPVNHFKY
ncbi:sugar lactone lactonase YvrE [Chitinophaga niastensis]|uniref:Sugar lactone lactonase YvrE n=2 Tax=Chitinophaga niastensis TaxID=536980 RepID=A0A2P8HNH3_CHINA|nr:sugar lactone lactonase YvrE [Chitinophaga niastensis]